MLEPLKGLTGRWAMQNLRHYGILTPFLWLVGIVAIPTVLLGWLYHDHPWLGAVVILSYIVFVFATLILGAFLAIHYPSLLRSESHDLQQQALTMIAQGNQNITVRPLNLNHDSQDLMAFNDPPPHPPGPPGESGGSR